MSLTAYRLDELPKARLNGQTVFLAGRTPSVRSVRNVLYVPPSRALRDGDWGLIDEQDRLLPESIPSRGGRDSGSNVRPSLFNQRIDEIPDRKTISHWPGTHYYLGFSVPHFGEFLLETLSKLWAFPLVTDTVSRVVIHQDASSMGFFDLQPYARDILAAAAVEPGQILACRKPILFERMIIPQSAFEIRGHVFPEMFDLTSNIARTVMNRAGNLATTDQPLYFSRARLPPGARKLDGEEEIEHELARRGAKIVHPEHIPIVEQIQLINAHGVIAGMVGSAFHLLLFALERKSVSYIEPRQWTSANFPMTDKAMCHSSRFYFLDRPGPSDLGNYSAEEPEDLRNLINALIRDLGL